MVIGWDHTVTYRDLYSSNHRAAPFRDRPRRLDRARAPVTIKAKERTVSDLDAHRLTGMRARSVRFCRTDDRLIPGAAPNQKHAVQVMPIPRIEVQGVFSSPPCFEQRSPARELQRAKKRISVSSLRVWWSTREEARRTKAPPTPGNPQLPTAGESHGP